MSFSSTSGPLFMIGTVSIGMLNNPALVPLILYPHYLGVLTIGFFYRFHNNNNNKLYHLSIPENQEPVLNRNNENTIPIGKIISNSVKKQHKHYNINWWIHDYIYCACGDNIRLKFFLIY